jgi:cell division initiation protein
VEISSKEVREVEFRERMRGYHQDDVDEFLEQVARGIEVLEAKVLEAEQRASELASRRSSVQVQPVPPPQSAAPFATDDTIQRTLLLAQRTADQLLADAKADAEELLQSARERSGQVIEDARARANALVEEKARLVASEVDALEARRADLLRELAHISEVVSSSRNSLKDSLTELIRSIETAVVFEYPNLGLSTEEEPFGERANSSDAERAQSSRRIDSGNDAWIAEGSDGELGSESTPNYGQREFSDDAESDRTMVFPSVRDRLDPGSADLTFGRPSFQLLDGDGPSTPILFDDESPLP